MTVGIIGAGKTGRGFLGRLMHALGNKIIFVDKDIKLVEELRVKKEYIVSYFGGEKISVKINNYQVLHAESVNVPKVLSLVDLLFISVGAMNFQEVSSNLLIPILEEREKLNITTCFPIITAENAIEPARKINKMIDESASIKVKTNISESAIFCTTIEDKSDCLNILSEDFNTLPFDIVPFEKENIDFPVCMKPEQDFPLLLKRKIFTYNCASAVIGYLGYLKKIEWYSDASNDSVIESCLLPVYDAINTVLCKEFKVDLEEQQSFAAKSLVKFQNKAIKDSLDRNIRDASRKLSADERICGPILLMAKYNIRCSELELVAAVALQYAIRNEPDINKLYQEKGLISLIVFLTEISNKSILESIESYFNKVQSCISLEEIIKRGE